MPLVSYAQYKLCQDEFVISLSILQKEIQKFKSRLLDVRVLKFFSINEEECFNSIFSLERVSELLDEECIMEVCKRVENMFMKLQIKQFSPIIWKLLYKDSVPNNIKESFDLYTNSIPVDYYLKKDGYVSKRSRKMMKHVINKNESAKKNYVVENIINIPPKIHESPTKELGNWSRSARDLFTHLNDSPGPGAYYTDEMKSNNNNETLNSTFGTSERSNFEIINYEEGPVCPRLKDGYIHEAHKHNNKNRSKNDLFSLMNKSELNWGENDEEWNELFNNMLENMKQEYYEKYGIECKIFDINLQNEMSEEEKERLITELRDWIKNGKGDLLTFFQTYFKDMRPSQILQYLDLLESLLPDNSTRCVICFRMIDEHNIEELTDCISVHQTILQEIYKARLQKKVVNIWLNKNEEREMKEKSGEIPKSIGNKIKSKLSKIRRKKSVVESKNNYNDNTHDDIQLSVTSNNNTKMNETSKEGKVEKKEEEKEKEKKEIKNKKDKLEKKKNKKKNGKDERKVENPQQQQQQQNHNNNNNKSHTNTQSKQNKSNPYDFFNADEKNIEKIISENNKNNEKLINEKKQKKMINVETLLKQQQNQQNFSPIPNISPNITLTTPLDSNSNQISTPFSFSEDKGKKNKKNSDNNNTAKEKRFKTSTNTTSSSTTKRKSQKSKKERKSEKINSDEDYDIVAEGDITDNWEYYTCDMKNSNKILCKQCKKKILSHSFEELIVCSGKIKESNKYLKFITTLKRQEKERKMKEKNEKKNNKDGKTVKEKSKLVRTLSTETYDSYNSEDSTPSETSFSSSSNAYFKFNEKEISRKNNSKSIKSRQIVDNNNNDISITPMLKPKRLLDTMNNVDILTPSSSSYSINSNSPITPSSSTTTTSHNNNNNNRSMRLSQIYKNTILEEKNNESKPPTSKHTTVNSIKPILNEQNSNHHQPSPLINEYISNSTPSTPNDTIEVDKYGNALYIPPQLDNNNNNKEEESKNRFLMKLNKLQMKKSKTISMSDLNNSEKSIERPKTTTNLQQNEQNVKVLKSKRVEQLITEETPLESMKKQTFKYNNKQQQQQSIQIEIPNNEKHGRDSIFKMKLAAELSNDDNHNDTPSLLSVRSYKSPSPSPKMNITTAPSRIISTPIIISNNKPTTTNQFCNNNYSNKPENDTNNICPFCKKQIAQHSYDELENCLAKEDKGIESNSGIDITDICMTCHTLLSSHTIPKLEKCIAIQEDLIEEAKILDTVALDRYNKYKKRIKEQQERNRKEKLEMQKQSIRN